jgi:hypothetical protein
VSIAQVDIMATRARKIVMQLSIGRKAPVCRQ